MNGFRNVRACLVLACAALTGACASLGSRDPLNVTVAGVEGLPGEGMELRMLVKLRVQNPNDASVEYDGIAVDLDVQGRSFASGVSAETGVVPGFGEAVVSVPVTVSMLRMVRQVMGMLDGERVERVKYEMHGKLSGTSAFTAHRFSASGDFQLPQQTPESAPSDGT
jgi:LEA14-like dessication related protein